MKDYKRIYKLPYWYWENKRHANRNAITASGAIDISLVDREASKKNSANIEDWIISNIWGGNTEDKQFLINRLAFLYELAEKDNKKYSDMSIEKELIYSFDTSGEIGREASKKYYMESDNS